MKRLTAGLAIAATLLHVAALSLHVAMMASLALAGDAAAGMQPSASVICQPGRRGGDIATAAAGVKVGKSENSRTAATTFCPVCAGGGIPAWVLPVTPALPILVARDQPAAAAVTPADVVSRHEAMRKQSRGPPQRI